MCRRLLLFKTKLPDLIEACISADATKSADRISRRILRQVISMDPVAARHALALAVEVARKVGRTDATACKGC